MVGHVYGICVAFLIDWCSRRTASRSSEGARYCSDRHIHVRWVLHVANGRKRRPRGGMGPEWGTRFASSWSSMSEFPIACYTTCTLVSRQCRRRWRWRLASAHQTVLLYSKQRCRQEFGAAAQPSHPTLQPGAHPAPDQGGVRPQAIAVTSAVQALPPSIHRAGTSVGRPPSPDLLPTSSISYSSSGKCIPSADCAASELSSLTQQKSTRTCFQSRISVQLRRGITYALRSPFSTSPLQSIKPPLEDPPTRSRFDAREHRRSRHQRTRRAAPTDLANLALIFPIPRSSPPST